MLVSLALVLAPALTPRNSRLKDAMAQLDGALKSLDTDTSEKGVIMEGVMGATTERRLRRLLRRLCAAQCDRS